MVWLANGAFANSARRMCCERSRMPQKATLRDRAFGCLGLTFVDKSGNCAPRMITNCAGPGLDNMDKKMCMDPLEALGAAGDP